jgi:hypothetical protein
MKNNSLDLTLHDMLLLVGIKGSTGELVVESGNNIGTMLIHQGKILQAFSPYSRAIGDLLVEDGLLSDTELIETLKIQKRNAYAPLGSLLLKMGRVTFEVVEMMVHAQIRTAVKEFQSWNNVNFSFVGKDIKPYDHIHLTVHEFISPDTMQSAKAFLSLETTSGQSSPAAESSTIA